MKRKKILFKLICAAISLTIIGGTQFSKSVFASEDTTSESSSSSYNDEGLIIEDNVLVSGKEASGDIVIPSNVTEIKENAFLCNDKITKVTVSNGVKIIGKYSFGNCENLTEVVLPDSVENIEDCAFQLCKSLKKITMSSNLQSIGVGAFESCKSLTEITIPDTVKSIGMYAFMACDNLETVYINTDKVSVTSSTFPVGINVKANTTTNNSNSDDSTNTNGVIPTLKPGWNFINNTWYYADNNSKIVKSQWYYNGYDWYYLQEDGSMAVGMTRVDDTVYCFNENGDMATGWVKSVRMWYYMNPISDGTKGSMVKSKWVYSNGKWYYLTEDGTMAANTIINGYKVDQNGAWIQ